MFHKNSRFEIETPVGWCSFSGVMLKGQRAVWRIVLDDLSAVEATPDHQFFDASGRAIPVSSIEAGTVLQTKKGVQTVVSVAEAGTKDVYDIVEVANANHQFVVSDCFITKNCDEFAFLRTATLASEFWTSVQPTLAEGGSCIITSTPKSDEDQFAQIWKGAIDNTDEFGNPTESGRGKNDFFAVKVPWWEHPHRDEEWAKPFRETLGEARFRQEFSCDFVSDDETLINPLTLIRLTAKEPEFYTNKVRWFQEPMPNKAYVVGLDPSLGTGGDYAAIQVFQLPEMIQVAEWQHNRTDTRGQVRVLLQVLHFLDATLRDNPDQFVEPEIYWTVENNSIGEALLIIIEDTGEERFPGLFVSEKKRKGQSRRFRKGMLTDNRKKLSACARFKSLVESDRACLNSQQLIKQLKSFVATETSFKAKPGEHDDLVMATMLCVRMLDVVNTWGTDMGDLKEYIGDSELFEEAMPVVI